MSGIEDRLRSFITLGYKAGLSQKEQLQRFRHALGFGGPAPRVSRADRKWHADVVQRAETQMHREQIVGHDASHTATPRPPKR